MGARSTPLAAAQSRSIWGRMRSQAVFNFRRGNLRLALFTSFLLVKMTTIVKSLVCWVSLNRHSRRCFGWVGRVVHTPPPGFSASGADVGTRV
jgi:hypothetical protein